MNKYSNNYKLKSNKDTLLNIENNIQLNKLGKSFISSKNNESGITMVALVVTIVVLLILAGISLGALTGDNGIINHAKDAKGDTEYAQWEEQIDVAIIDAESKHRNPTMDDVIDELINKGVIDDASQVNKKDGTITTNEPTYTIPDKLDDYIVPLFEPGKIADKNETYTDDNGDKATIPKGFEILPEAPTIEDGLVIQDEEGNQFVWIPVETPVADKEADGTTNKAMAIKNGDNYRGLLYDFTSDGSTVKSGCTTTTSSYREPDIVSDYDNDTTYNNGLFTKESLQKEYNNMMKSVEQYHGFYVGRYELGLDTKNNNAPVVKNASTNAGITTADASNSDTYRWYGLYSKSKEFASEDNNKSVVSTMIWGSQYDAMLNWMAKQGETVGTANNSKRNTDTTTGSNTNDEIRKVFDLYGCHRELTLEAGNTSTRVPRGGYSSSSYAPSNRDIYNPRLSNRNYSARLTLYIK